MLVRSCHDERVHVVTRIPDFLRPDCSDRPSATEHEVDGGKSAGRGAGKGRELEIARREPDPSQVGNGGRGEMESPFLVGTSAERATAEEQGECFLLEKGASSPDRRTVQVWIWRGGRRGGGEEKEVGRWGGVGEEEWERRRGGDPGEPFAGPGNSPSQYKPVN